MAFFAASLKVSERAAPAGMAAAVGAAASRTSTTCARHASQSGFTRLTTKSAASVIVTACAKTSQSLRMESRAETAHCSGVGRLGRLLAQRVANLSQQHDFLGR